mgnify:CR=1 FL=1
MSDEERMKQRLAIIHSRYTAPGDHDQFLHKLTQAKEKTTTPAVRETLEQIIIRREELRPKQRSNGVSSIPTDVPLSSEPVIQPDVPHENTSYQNNTAESLYQLANGTINISKLQTTWL